MSYLATARRMGFALSAVTLAGCSTVSSHQIALENEGKAVASDQARLELAGAEYKEKEAQDALAQAITELQQAQGALYGVEEDDDKYDDLKAAEGVAKDALSQRQAELYDAENLVQAANDRIAREVLPVNGRRTQGDNVGIAYFLPRQLATVTVKRTDSTRSKAIAGVVAARTSFQQAKEALALRESEEFVARQAVGHAASSTENRHELVGRREAATIARMRASSLLEAAEEGLKAAQAKLKALGERPTPLPAGAFDVSVAISLQAPSPDPDFGYRMDPRHSVLRDDQHKLAITSNGLLSSSNIVAVDRTGDVLVEIGTLAGAIANRGGADTQSFSGDDSNGDGDRCVNSPNEITAVVDFADPRSVELMNARLTCLGVRLKTAGRIWADETRPVNDVTYGEPPRDAIDGIVYRTPVEVQVTVEKCTNKQRQCLDDSGWFATQTLGLSLPQAGPISVLQQDSGFMTKTSYDAVFDNGILTSYSDNRPSEVLAVASTPMRIIDGVFDGISKIISLRTGRANDLAELSSAQLQLLNAQALLQRADTNNLKLDTDAQLALLNARAQLERAGVSNQQLLTDAEVLLLASQANLQAAPANANATINAAQLSSLQSQTNLLAAPANANATINAAQLSSLQSQLNLQNATLTGQQQLLASELALLNAQNQLLLAEINAAGPISTAQLAALITTLRVRQETAELERCIATQEALVDASDDSSQLNIDVCLEP